jgi:hypothetical protein
MRKVICSRCSRLFGRGVTRVKRFVVFHFCAGCHSGNRAECDSIMQQVSK